MSININTKSQNKYLLHLKKIEKYIKEEVVNDGLQDSIIFLGEKETTTLSIQINRNLGENDRSNYRGTPVPTKDVKSNKIKKDEK